MGVVLSDVFRKGYDCTVLCHNTLYRKCLRIHSTPTPPQKKGGWGGPTPPNPRKILAMLNNKFRGSFNTRA